MERDEPGDAPDSRPEVAPPQESSAWTIEDFDDFAPFEAGDPPDDHGAEQTTLQFDSIPPEPPVPAAFPEEASDRPSEDEGRHEPPIPSGQSDEGTDDLAQPAARSAVDEPVDDLAAGDEPAEEADGIFEDTVEAMFEGGGVASATPAEDDDVDVPDFAAFTSEQYIQTTTQEFVDLAEEVAKAATTEHELSAVAAEIPGLESGVVGLEDVVVAAGEDPDAIAVREGSNLALRVSTALGLAVIFFASLYDPLFIGLFVVALLFLAAGEFYSTLMRSGYRPLGLIGLLGTLGALVGTWVWGVIAIPVSLSGTLVVTLLVFGLASDRRDPLTNAALTVLGTAWIGGLGAFLLDFLRSDDYGWLVVATVLTVALMDVAQYAIGKRIGRNRLAAVVSPNKTVEGLVGGVVAALAVGVAFGLLSEEVLILDLQGPIDLGAGVALGVVVAIVAPLGDLTVSVMKRSLGVKDMGTLLPGHGGLLDRIDAMLFTIPTAWIVFAWAGLLT